MREKQIVIKIPSLPKRGWLVAIVVLMMLAGGVGYAWNAFTLANPNDGDLLSAAQFQTNNLALTNKVTELQNAIDAAAMPPGTIIAFGGAVPPSGWLACDGSLVSRTTYAPLFTAIGNSWGGGDGSTTFNLPDLRGYFLRGADKGAGHDPNAATRTAMAGGGNAGDNVGSVEADAYRSHTHTATDSGHTHGITDGGHTHAITDPGHSHTQILWTGGSAVVYGGSGSNLTSSTTSSNTTGITINSHTTGVTVNSGNAAVSIGSSGGSESRPLNAAVLYIIKT